MQFFPGQVLLVHCLFLDFSPSWGAESCWVLASQGKVLQWAWHLCWKVFQMARLFQFFGDGWDRKTAFWRMDDRWIQWYVLYNILLSIYDIYIYMGVSKNRGFPPKSSILIGFSIIFTIHFGVPLFLETPIYTYICYSVGVATPRILWYYTPLLWCGWWWKFW